MKRWHYLLIIAVAIAGGAAIVAWLKVRPMLSGAGAPPPLPEVLGARPESPDVPKERPFVGLEGSDAYGYPLRTADRNALLHLLRLGMFDELERYLAEYQADFEADPKKEYWPIDAFEGFQNEDPSLAPLLDEWVETRPSSWAAWMARGTYRAGLGWFHRGGASSIETSVARFRAMRSAFDRAKSDLRTALELKPTLVAAHRHLIIIGTGSSDAELRKSALDAALAICPSCFQVRAAYILGLRPIWGGSYEAMEAFAGQARAHADRNQRLEVLAGYPALERCRTAVSEKNRELAAQQCSSLAGYQHWELDLQLARHLLAEERPEEALKLLDRAMSQRPQDLNVLKWRARALESLKRWSEMGEMVLAIRRQNVTDAEIAEECGHAIEVLLWAAGEEARQNRFVSAHALIALALSIHPDHRAAKELRSRLESAQAGARPPEPAAIDPTREAEIDLLRSAVADAPDSVDARVALDRALEPYQRFDEIKKMWDEYLGRHPEDARALFERGGTHTRLRDADAALADFDAACRLGVAEACSFAQRLRASLGR